MRGTGRLLINGVSEGPRERKEIKKMKTNKRDGDPGTGDPGTGELGPESTRARSLASRPQENGLTSPTPGLPRVRNRTDGGTCYVQGRGSALSSPRAG